MEDELKKFDDIHAYLKKQQGGKNKGINNYAEARAKIVNLWKDGSRQKKREAWEAEQKKAERKSSRGKRRRRV